MDVDDLNVYTGIFMLLLPLVYSIILFIRDSLWIKKRRAKRYQGDLQEQLQELESLPVTTLLEKIKEKKDSRGSLSLRLSGILSLRLKAIQLLGDTGDPRAVEPLIHLLGEGNSNIRGAVITALGNLGDLRAVEPLIHLLGEDNPNIRGAVIAALRKLGDLRAVQPLIRVLENDAMGTRLVAVKALGDLGDPRAVELLIHVFGNSDIEGQLLIIEALRKIHDPRVVEFFIHILQNENPAIRMTAVKILEQIGDVQAIKPLVPLLKDENSAIRSQTMKALDKMHWKPKNVAERTIYALLKKDWDSLESLGSSAIEPLMNIFQGRTSGLRKDAETALQIIYALIEVVIFGNVEIKDFAPQTTLLNPDVSTVTMPMSALEKIEIYSESYDFHLVERFITYAVNYIGQGYLKKHVEVHVYGDPDKLHPNLRNSFKNLCKCVEVHEVDSEMTEMT